MCNTLTGLWLYSLCFVLSLHFFPAVMFSICALSGQIEKIHIPVLARVKGIVTEHKNPIPLAHHHLEDGWSIFFWILKIQKEGTVAPLPLSFSLPAKSAPVLYITEQSMLMLLLLPKYNLILLITPWLPWWTAGLLGKCARNCRTLCWESGYVHSSSWTWTVEWPRSGELVMLIGRSFSQETTSPADQLILISVAHLVWLQNPFGDCIQWHCACHFHLNHCSPSLSVYRCY